MSEPKSLFGAASKTQTPYQQQPMPMTVAPTTGVPAMIAKPFTMSEVVSFGEASALAAASVVQKINATTRAGDVDEVGKLLNGLVVGAKEYDVKKLKGGGLFGLLKKKKREIEAHFASVDSQTNKLVDDLGQKIVHFRMRMNDADALAEENRQRAATLKAEVAEAEARIAWMRANVPTVDPSDTFTARTKDNWDQVIALAEKRVDDHRRQIAACEMQDIQIALMRDNAVGLVMDFHDIKTSTIPSLQMGFSLYITSMEAKRGAEFGKAVKDMTNEVMQRNAKALGQATVAVQTNLARSSIDLETLNVMSSEAISAIDKRAQIQAELAARLAVERTQYEKASADLAARLAQ